MRHMAGTAFSQVLDPAHTVLGSTLLALVPVVALLLLLAVFRLSAWQAVLIGAVVTVVLGVTVWRAPLSSTLKAYGIGAGTGFWSVDWIVFWGVIIYNTLVVTGAFDAFKNWLVAQATADIRVQTLLIAWAFGALLEGLVGFGYPWAVVAPLLIAFGIADLAAIRVAALANNAPVSFGALGAPIIGLAAVTGLPLNELSASIGKIVAVLALAPPWILIYLVAGKRGFRDGWPLAIVGSLGYIAGQLPTSQYLGPYLPDVIGSLVCFAALLTLLKFWQPKTILGFGGTEIEPLTEERPGVRAPLRGLLPFVILIVVVVAWTGPWSKLGAYVPVAPTVSAKSSLDGTASATVFKFAPFIAGTAILVSWLLIALFLAAQPGPAARGVPQHAAPDVGRAAGRTAHLRLAAVYNFAGLANSDGQRLLPAGHLVRGDLADPGLDRGRAVGQQHVVQRGVRPFPVFGGETPACAGAAVPVAELAGRRGRQADRAADRERRRGDHPVRPQRGPGHPLQPRLDAGHPRLSDPHWTVLLLRDPGIRTPIEIPTPRG